jgi:hypothetical protein
MQKFRYRIPRYTVDLPARVDVDGLSVEGRCTQISCEGMQLDLADPLPESFVGTVVISCTSATIQIRVRRAHSGAQQDAFKFIFESDRERLAVAHLVTQVAMRNCGPRLMLAR